jgi:hypothetical protein
LIQIQALLAIKAYDRVTAVISSLLDCTCWPRDYLRYFKLQPIKRQSTLTNPAILEGLSEYYGREFATRIQLMASYLPTEQAPSDKQQFSSARRYVQSVVMKYPESSSVNDAIEACLLLARLYVKDSGKDLDAAKVINHFLGRFSAHFTSGQQRQPTASGVVSTAAAATTVDVSLWIRLLVDFARYIGKGGGSKKHVALIIEEAKYISATVNSSYLAGLLARIEHEFAVNTIKN